MKESSTKLTMLIFLLGITMGALDSGIVAPARNIIAGELNVSQSSSIWMITIYTLAFAVSMPIIGKLSDRLGRKKIYIFSIVLFAIGSLFCGLADFFNSYQMLLVSRVIEAIGGGGIMPIATSYIGTSFPPEKRGAALGVIGAIFGICTVVGPTLGSAILEIFGNGNWGFLFFINIPISIVVVILALKLNESKAEALKSKLDILGSIVLTVLILSIMYALTNLQFNDIAKSVMSKDVLPYLIVFIISIPTLIFVEKRAEDPVIDLSYFVNKDIVITLAISLIVGCGLMSLVFLPQFSDNVLKLPAGSGGYFSTIFAVFMGISSVVSGKLLDKVGAKIVLIIGFIISIAGSLYFAFATAYHPSLVNLIIGIVILGSGFGFTFATPLNYLMLKLVSDEEATMGQSTVSLVRSIGVAVGPNLLVNFVSTAGKKIPSAIEKVMPKIPGHMASASSSMSGNANMFVNASSNNIFDLIQKTVVDKFDSLSKLMGANPEFAHMKNAYLTSLANSKDAITNAFQSTLDKGYSNLFLCSAAFCIVALIITFFISKKENLKPKKSI